MQNTKEKSIIAYIGKSLLFPLAVFYFELVLGVSVGGHVIGHYGIYIGLFSVIYGWAFFLLGTALGAEKGNRILQAGLLLLLGFLYGGMYFMYCEFRMFYDFNTMFYGATDAIGDFWGDIISMLCSAGGVCHVLLFLLPFALYLLFGRRAGMEERITWKERGWILGCALTLLFLTVSGIYFSDTDSGVYDTAYHYDTAVADFGLLTGLRLEIANTFSSQDEEISFEYAAADVKAGSIRGDGQELYMEPESEASAGADAYADTEAVSRSGEDGSADGREDGSKEDAGADEEAQIGDTDDTSETDVRRDGDENGQIPGKNAIDIDFEALSQKGGAYAALDEYVSSLHAASKNEYTGLFAGKNLIFITAEAFTAEAIDKRRTPTLYRLANKGIQFTDYYQPASSGTTGGEYNNIFGMLPTAGGSSMKKTAGHYNWATLASRLSEQGYYGKAYHNNDYTYYDRHRTHINLGFSDGYEGKGNGMEKILTRQWPESDLEMVQGTLPDYINKQPFFIYYMSVSGHSLYDFEKNAMSQKHRDEVKRLNYSEPVKAYLACQIELEDALTYLVDQLERLHMEDDTVIVVASDHFPYGLDQDSGASYYLQELYRMPIANSLVRDHNRLIIWSGCLEKQDVIGVDEPTSSLDILPTLCNLFGVRYDSRLLPGRDVFSSAEPLVFNLGHDWKTDKGTYIASKGKFIPADEREEVDPKYIERINAVVKNKLMYCKGVLAQDYFRHLFEEEAKDGKDN